MPKILIVDDEPAIRESLAFMLERDGFGAVQAATLEEASARWRTADLIVLDLKLPDGNGIDFLRGLRAESDVPVIVLTSRDDVTDRVVGLELGADDYVTKPFSPREVVARARAVLRRPRRPADTKAPLRGPGGLEVNVETRRAFVGGSELALTRVELDLLSMLLSAPGRVFDRARLLAGVWKDTVVADRTVDAHVKSIRKKIAEAGGDPEVIEAVRGIGYRLREEPT